MKLNIKHNNKIFLAMLAFVVIAFIGVAHSENNTPEKDADGYYLIGTKAELEWFRGQVNAATYSVKYNAKLVNDIDLKGSEIDQWVPIGKEQGVKSYKGIFDGQGYMIKGLYINNSEDYQGLFGVIENDNNVGSQHDFVETKIKNLRVFGSVTANNYVAGVCGSNYGAIISNCSNSVTVKGKSYIGGICGYMAYAESRGSSKYTSIYSSANYGLISQLSGGLEHTLGGICGCVINGNIYNSVNSPSVTPCPAISLCGTAKTGSNGGYVDISYCENNVSSKYNAAICDCVIAESGEVVIDRCCNLYGYICNIAQDIGGIGLCINYCDYYAGVLADTPNPVKDGTGNIRYTCNCYTKSQSVSSRVGIINYAKILVGTHANVASAYGTAKVYSVVSSDPSVATSSAYTEAKKVGKTTFKISASSLVGYEEFPVNVVENIDLYDKEMYLGKKFAFTVPEAINFVTWSSSNKNVATVDENGTITALSEGRTTIVAKAQDGSFAHDECTISVVVPESKKITLKAEKVYVGGKINIDVASQIGNPVGWASSNPTVATVDENGQVTGLSEGSAVISVKASDGSGNSAQCTVNVKKEINLTLNKTEGILRLGTTEKLTVTNTASEDEQQVEWITSNTDVAVVDQEGNVTPVARGNARITVKSAIDTSKTAYCDFVVRDAVEAEMNMASATMSIGDLQLAVKITACDEDDSKTFVWTSSDESVATVDQNGKVTSHSQGSTIITATLKEDANVKVTSTITVEEGTSIPEKDADGYYLISNKSHLVWFRDQVNGGSTNINAKLVSNIDLGCTEDFQWTPMGTTKQPYSGVFDGQGYVVKGLCINNSASNQEQGLFGTVSGTIKNITVAGTVKALKAGGVCGYLKSGGKITASTNTAEIEGNEIGGGIVSCCEGKINNCVNYGDVSAVRTSAGVIVSAGGIVGDLNDVESRVFSCINYGTVTCKWMYAGGIIGHCPRGIIEGCINNGQVICSATSLDNENSSGGIVGRLIYAQLSNSLNLGAVTGYQNAGGVCGFGDTESIIDNCVNKGSVFGVDKTGGILGTLFGGTAANCVNAGVVNGDNYVGGVCGYFTGYFYKYGSYPAHLDNSINIGNISNLLNGNYTGAIIGYANGVTGSNRLSNCGYQKGRANYGVGYDTVWGGPDDEPYIRYGKFYVYTSSNLPATAALILPNRIEKTKTVTAVTIYPENAYNISSAGISLSSSNSAVASVNGNTITGNSVGSASITANVSGLLGRTEALSLSKEIKVCDFYSSASFNPELSKSSEIAGNSITAKIEAVFEDLRDTFINVVDVVVEYATDVLEFVSAQKSTLSGATEPIQETGKVTFKLNNASGVYISEGISYTFGDITFKIKNGASVGETANIAVTSATYMLADGTEHTASVANAKITVAQPVTSITVTSQSGTTLLVTDSLQLNAEVLPTDAETKDIQPEFARKNRQNKNTAQKSLQKS